MYYKLKKNILFRNYKKYGLLTDNSMFGYRTYNDTHLYPGEEFVSESGCVMMATLSKEPRHIDTLIDNLLDIFVNVEREELKKDTIEFFDLFVEKGFLSCGTSFEECNNQENVCLNREVDEKRIDYAGMSVECSKNLFNQNDFLRSLHIEIANECNERCVHCYIPHELKTKMINSDLFYKIIEEGKAMNIINVTLSGGEPLLHKDFIYFLKKCKELDLSVNVLTNLTVLTDEIIEEMKKNPLLCVQTSIYSMDRSIHDAITKVKGSLKKTTNNILKLKEANIPLQISCPIMKQNKDSFHSVVNFGEEHGIPVAIDYVIFASYDHSNCNLTNRLTLSEIGQAFDLQASDAYVNNLHEQSKEKLQLTSRDSVCSICRYYICVSAEGMVFPCIGWQENVIGDLNKQTLHEIWEKSDKIKQLRNIKWKDFPKCMQCKDRGYCNVCMMSNSNESSNADAFEIQKYHCEVAHLIHEKVEHYRNHSTS